MIFRKDLVASMGMLHLASPRVAIHRRFYAQEFCIQRVLRLPKRHMYEVVGDVEKYHEFVPYCLESTVLKPHSDTKPAVARLRVGWKSLDEKFESLVTYSENTVSAIASNNEMFKELSSIWTIKDLNAKQCSVTLQLRFQFQNALYDFMAQSAGGLVAKKVVEAFTKRATEAWQQNKR